MDERYLPGYGRVPSVPTSLSLRRKTLQMALLVSSFSLPMLLAVFVRDGGRTDLWLRAGLSGSVVEEVRVVGGAAPMRYALVMGRGVYRSFGSDTHWESANSGLPYDRWGRIAVHVLAAAVNNLPILYAGRSDFGAEDSAFSAGLYWTDDGGATWLIAGQLFAGKGVQAIGVQTRPSAGDLPSAPVNRAGYREAAVVCVAAGGELYRSNNGGSSWLPLNWRGVDTRVSSVAIHPEDSDIVYLGTKGGGLYGTFDGGGSWRVLNSGLDDLAVFDIAIAADDTRVMYLATDGGVYRSTDSGSTWALLPGPANRRMVNTLVVHPYDGDFLCVGLQYGGVHCSDNGGTRWMGLTTGLGNATVLSIALDPQEPATLWAGTVDGVWRYTFGVPVTAKRAPAVPIPTPTSSSTHDQMPQPTNSATTAPQQTATPLLTKWPTISATWTPTASPSLSPTATRTAEPSATPSPTLTPTFTAPPPPPPSAIPPTPTKTVVPR